MIWKVASMNLNDEIKNVTSNGYTINPTLDALNTQGDPEFVSEVDDKIRARKEARANWHNARANDFQVLDWFKANYNI